MHMPTGYWLMKSEPDVFSIRDLERQGRTPWTGVRNYQARNYMRDAMRPGDRVLFYHSSTEVPGVAGLARVCSNPYPDASAWDRKSEFFDPRSTPDKPVWMLVDIAFDRIFKRHVPLSELRTDPALKALLVLKRGMRLSIQPVEPEHFQRIVALGS